MKLGTLDPWGQAQAGSKEVINDCGDDIDGQCPLARRLALAAAYVVSPISCPRNGSVAGSGGGFQHMVVDFNLNISLRVCDTFKVSEKSTRFLRDHSGTSIAEAG
jgi:hypothetical protein